MVLSYVNTFENDWASDKERLHPAWISRVQRIVSDVGIKIKLVFITDWIGLQEPSKFWRIVARAVVVEPAFGIIFAARIAERVSQRAGACDLIAERVVGIACRNLTSAVGHGGDIAQSISVVELNIAQRRPRAFDPGDAGIG